MRYAVYFSGESSMSKAKSKHKLVKILFVDDSISMRKLLRAMIEADGYHNIT